MVHRAWQQDEREKRLMPRMRVCSLALGLVVAFSGAAIADGLRVGNDAPTSIPYCALDIGMERGIFHRHGLDIEASTFFGSAKGQPALVGGTIDVLLGA